MTAKRTAKRAATPKVAPPSIDARVDDAVSWLRSRATKATLQGMSRYAIPSDNAFGVAMKDIKALGKKLGRDHDLALALWKTGHYEARILTAFVADPAALTAAQMDRFCRDFDNWAYCDTLSFHLFDRSPHAWSKAKEWSTAKGEFQKRTAFALLWSLALHDKKATDAQFVESLRWIERAAGDDRNFVKKAVNMALRAIGRRKMLRGAVVALATRLAESPSAPAQWIGKDALRELKSR